MFTKLMNLINWKSSGLAFALAAAWAVPSQAGEPVYFAQPWFHRGPDVNLLTTPAGVRVAVNTAGPTSPTNRSTPRTGKR